SVDIKEGRCIKLVRGVPGTGRVISEDPLAVALRWEQEGAKRLHIIDLDGSFEGHTRNREIVARIIKSLRVPVEVGGGIRSLQSAVEMASLGARWIILGTAALEDPSLARKVAEAIGSDRLILSLDSRRGLVVKKGWTSETKGSVIDWAKTFEPLHPDAFLYTDVDIEGTLEGLRENRLSPLKGLLKATRVPIIYAGGISSLDDIRVLARIGVMGAVVGAALYEGRISLKEAEEVSERAEGDG
ncbi:1-(5-phosphoribosyl)-5-[(5-phosphoribosylamino)methylideneamino]imidazole-4-carboxamide isomerase, partial [Candidatus Bathyarchaeota archaeon]|nr:1-(5-phosphoribosyl)-5-[(5-phosphoribosylamino)methylideneamino]imidazole-4-carboxamide isomerase [Candidatus Bathyarchaeota archaeon]